MLVLPSPSSVKFSNIEFFLVPLRRVPGCQLPSRRAVVGTNAAYTLIYSCSDSNRLLYNSETPSNSQVTGVSTDRVTHDYTILHRNTIKLRREHHQTLHGLELNTTPTSSFGCLGRRLVGVRWLRLVLRRRLENPVFHRRRGGGRWQAHLVRLYLLSCPR
jgi:hypothetical protein